MFWGFYGKLQVFLDSQRISEQERWVFDPVVGEPQDEKYIYITGVGGAHGTWKQLKIKYSTCMSN